MPTSKPKSHLFTALWLYPRHWGILLLVLMVPATIGIWLLLFNRDWPIRQLFIVPNHPPVADVIPIRAAADEAVTVDVRAYIRDPDGATPRLVGCDPPQFGAVKRIDDYHFRYLAPSRDLGMDLFLYRILDDSGAQGNGWVFVNGEAH